MLRRQRIERVEGGRNISQRWTSVSLVALVEYCLLVMAVLDALRQSTARERQRRSMIKTCVKTGSSGRANQSKLWQRLRRASEVAFVACMYGLYFILRYQIPLRALHRVFIRLSRLQSRFDKCYECLAVLRPELRSSHFSYSSPLPWYQQRTHLEEAVT